MEFYAFLQAMIHQSTLNYGAAGNTEPLPVQTGVNNFSLLWEGSALPLAAQHYSIFTEVSESLLWAVNWPQMYGVVRAKVHP